MWCEQAMFCPRKLPSVGPLTSRGGSSFNGFATATTPPSYPIPGYDSFHRMYGYMGSRAHLYEYNLRILLYPNSPQLSPIRWTDFTTGDSYSEWLFATINTVAAILSGSNLLETLSMTFPGGRGINSNKLDIPYNTLYVYLVFFLRRIK